MRRVILLNPYSAGSHAQWAQGLAREWPAAAARCGGELEVEVFSLPGRHWKWRMHAAALVLVERMLESGALNQVVDAFIVTDMLDVAQFRAALPPGMRDVPVVVYFHENQLTFPPHPERPEVEWDRHYAWLNLTSAWLADAVWFNSHYHRQIFLEAVPAFISSFPSPRPRNAAERIAKKSNVVRIGLENDVLEAGKLDLPGCFDAGPPVVVWNHRWEYDKGPAAFLSCLDAAVAAGLDFRLAVMGQSFDRVPAEFAQMKERHAHRILVWGHRELRREYVEVLRSADLALVTAHHDFFGISVLEAAAAGLGVIAPNELAYPEHFGDEFLHDRQALEAAFLDALIRPPASLAHAAENYAWNQVAQEAWKAVLMVWNGLD